MKKIWKIHSFLYILLVLSMMIIMLGCHTGEKYFPKGFIGVTRIEMIDDLKNERHSFNFVLFTTNDIAEIDGFKDINVNRITINRGSNVYLNKGKEKAIGVMYEVEVEVKPVVCKMTHVKLSFDQVVKDINFGYYEIKDTSTTTENVEVLINYEKKENPNIYDLVLLIYNNSKEDINFEGLEIIQPSDPSPQQPVVTPVSAEKKIIYAYNIKMYSNITLEVPQNVFMKRGLLKLVFVTDQSRTQLITSYFIDLLPGYYQLKESGINVDNLIVN